MAHRLHVSWLTETGDYRAPSAAGSDWDTVSRRQPWCSIEVGDARLDGQRVV